MKTFVFSVNLLLFHDIFLVLLEVVATFPVSVHFFTRYVDSSWIILLIQMR